MHRFIELFMDTDISRNLINSVEHLILSKGAIEIDGKVNIPLHFKAAGMLIETAHFYNLAPKDSEMRPYLESTIQVFRAKITSRKNKQLHSKYAVYLDKTMLDTNAKVLFFLAAYGSLFGYEHVESYFSNICSGLFTMISNGPTIGGRFEGDKFEFLQDKNSYPEILGDAIVYMAKAATLQYPSRLQGILPFSIEKAAKEGVDPAKLLYAVSAILNKKSPTQSTSSLINILLDSAEGTIKKKSSPFLLTSLCSFIYTVDSLKVSTAQKHRADDLKEKAIAKVCDSFSVATKSAKAFSVKPLNTFSDLNKAADYMDMLLGYDVLRMLSPSVWYEDRIKSCSALNTLFDSVKLNDVARQEIIKEIAKCVM